MVSVVIATYRRDTSLAGALRSLTEQTFSDIEVLVVDDNADPEWNSKVRAAVDRYSDKLRITLIKNETNKGAAVARNIGIDSSKGEYITFLDDDDEYLPGKIEKQVDMMKQSDADYSISNIALYYEDGTLCEIRKRDYLNTSEADDLLKCHLKYNMASNDTIMFRADYVRRIKGFEPINVGDDFYLMMKAIENKGKFLYCDICEVKAVVHKGTGGLSSGQGKIDGENRMYEFKKQYFSQISLRDRRYIRMRHYAVLSFAYKRGGNALLFIVNGFHSVLTDPFQCIGLLRGRKI